MIHEPPPVCVEIACDDPWLAARRLVRGSDDLVFLDSAMVHPLLGRWSFVMADGFGRFRVEGGRAYWNGEAEAAPPLEALRRRLAACRQERLPLPSPFQGGAAGTFAYEAGRLFDRFPTPRPEPGEGPEIDLGFYDVVLAYEHAERRAWLISTGWPEPGAAARRARARARMEEVRARLAAPPALLDLALPPVRWTSNFDAAGYETAVARVVDYIRAGDIFQANFTQQFTAETGQLDPLAVHERLRRANPATFAALVLSPGRAVSSSSPERFVTVRAGAEGLTVEARPIKGTVPRSVEPTLDAFRGRELAASEKDRAENVMIVDLLRNDLSRVCAPGTVQVPRLCGVESYANVHHLVSVVTGRLRDGRDGLDLIAAAFPGGSITGAPKIRAMEIIRELEGRPRGVYCGSIGWLGFDGTLDLNIAIRTVTLENGTARFGVGGGITVLSDPAAEYRESLTKAERLFRAFAEAPR